MNNNHNNDFNQNNDYNQNNNYNQNNGYNQNNDYNQNNGYNQNNDYNQNNGYNQNNDYNQNNGYNQNNDYNQNNGYNQNNDYHFQEEQNSRNVSMEYNVNNDYENYEPPKTRRSLFLTLTLIVLYISAISLAFLYVGNNKDLVSDEYLTKRNFEIDTNQIMFNDKKIIMDNMIKDIQYTQLALESESLKSAVSVGKYYKQLSELEESQVFLEYERNIENYLHGKKLYYIVSNIDENKVNKFNELKDKHNLKYPTIKTDDFKEDVMSYITVSYIKLNTISKYFEEIDSEYKYVTKTHFGTNSDDMCKVKELSISKLDDLGIDRRNLSCSVEDLEEIMTNKSLKEKNDIEDLEEEEKEEEKEDK